jgi:MinD superfamily P-loop ATPase
MIISVASGKGGTGKTTISTNLAISLGDQCILLDCDVEEPNAHLFLHPRIAKSETVTSFVPEVDEERCTFCRRCADICRFRAIAVVGRKVLVFPQLCHSCGGCLAVCPEEAIQEGSRELGVVEWGEGAGVAMIQGRLRVGEAMSPPLIKKVRSYADPDPCRTVIIDAPPGTSCPVIAAMRGADYVLLVTEPTPFGLHDLRLAVGAVKVLGIPCGLVINRADMGDGQVRDYARQEGLPVLLEIPFDRRIAEAYSRGLTIVEEMPEWRQKFTELFAQIHMEIIAENLRGETP